MRFVTGFLLFSFAVSASQVARAFVMTDAITSPVPLEGPVVPEHDDPQPPGWSAWSSIGGVGTSDPASCSRGSYRTDLFVRGTDNALWHIWYAGGWSAWESLGGVLTSGPEASSSAKNRTLVFVLGTDRAVWYRSYKQ